jgi:hypothetical protein
MEDRRAMKADRERVQGWQDFWDEYGETCFAATGWTRSINALYGA